MEKALIRGYRHYWNAIDTLPPYMEKNLKEMPNNKGYRWKNVVFYGALPANENHSTIIFEKNPKGLIIHEYKIDGTYNHTIKPFGPKLDNIKNGVNKENNKIKSVKSVKFDKATKNSKQINTHRKNTENTDENDKNQKHKKQKYNKNSQNTGKSNTKVNTNANKQSKDIINTKDKPRRLLLNKHIKSIK
jgi:hypothetical protein